MILNIFLICMYFIFFLIFGKILIIYGFAFTINNFFFNNFFFLNLKKFMDSPLNWEYSTKLNTIWFLPEFSILFVIVFTLAYYIIFIWRFTTVAEELNLFVLKLIERFFYSLMLILFLFSWFMYSTNKYIYYKSYIVLNFFTFATKFLIIVLCSFLLVFIKTWHSKNQKNIFEFYLLLLGSIFFIFNLVSTTNLFIVYICLEGIALQSYVLAIFNFTNISIELVLKYFLLGSLSSGILLFGITLLYGVFGTLNFMELHQNFSYIFFDNNIISFENEIFLTKISFIFIYFGLFFKLGVFPLHIWVPGIYANSPNPVTAFFAVIIKFTFLIFILRLSFVLFGPFLYFFKFFFIFVSVGSMIVGALGAFKELKIKYFISYTSINQAGFILLGLCCNSVDGFLYSTYYLFIYIILLLGFLNFLLNLQQFYNQRSIVYFSDLKNFYKNNLLISFFFSFYILSFAGLPPFSGFFGKLHLYAALINSKLFFLLILSLGINLVSLYYYVKILKIIWFENLVNFDEKPVYYYLPNLTSFKILFFLTSCFNIFFIFFSDLYEFLIQNYVFSMLFLELNQIY